MRRPAIPESNAELGTVYSYEIGPTPSLALGILTAPRQGRDTLLNYTVNNLRHAGFNQHIDVYAQTLGTAINTIRPLTGDVSVHYETRETGTYTNWSRAAKHMLATTTADWLLIMEDDIEWCDKGAEILYYTINRITAGVDGIRLPRLGLLSCYTSPAMVSEAQHSIGWTEAQFAGKVKGLWGALALCFYRPTLQYVVNHAAFVNYKAKNAHDYLIGDILRNQSEPPLGVKIHIPSLVEHRGEISTIFSPDALKSTHIQHLRHGYKYSQNIVWRKHRS